MVQAAYLFNIFPVPFCSTLKSCHFNPLNCSLITGHNSGTIKRTPYMTSPLEGGGGPQKVEVTRFLRNRDSRFLILGESDL